MDTTEVPLPDDAFGVTGRVPGSLVTLEPLGLRYLEAYLLMLADPEGRRMTGTRATFGRRDTNEWLTRRAERTDRADWAITETGTGDFLGEVVLNDFDPAAASANFRIVLAGPAAYGRGFGTAATLAALEYAFNQVRLHRIALEVFDFNVRAQRCYAKAGFRTEGVKREAHHDEDGWHDVIVMARLATDPPPPDR